VGFHFGSAGDTAHERLGRQCSRPKWPLLACNVSVRSGMESVASSSPQAHRAEDCAQPSRGSVQPRLTLRLDSHDPTELNDITRHKPYYDPSSRQQ